MPHRCPDCNKLVAVASEDYEGDVALFCHRCKRPFGVAEPAEARLACRCGRRLHHGTIRQGTLTTACPRCRVLVQVGSDGATWIEAPRPRSDPARKEDLRLRHRTMTDDEIVGLVTERWELFRADRAWGRAEVAVGLRFDVFNRDGFRCRYCGRTPSDGIVLEADHVIPRAAGGGDEIANLVTACRDCNRGKSAKPALTPGLMRIN